MKLGLDIGSTTIKYVVLDEDNNIISKDYRRHYSHVKDNMLAILYSLKEQHILDEGEFTFALSGSAGMGFAAGCHFPFIQEVYATMKAANMLIPGTDCIIELGGEDAKILFLTDGVESRMNGSCAGGTGAFIDQMATLLDVTIDDMNSLAEKSEKLYNIASRCGVFAKTDIQPLLNQNVSKNDIAASIFKAVVNQTIGGLAQGRDIVGNVAYLGGPLSFMPELQKSFNESLHIEGICPENSLYYVAFGAAVCATDKTTLDAAIDVIEHYETKGDYAYNDPLFRNQEELDEFRARHAKDFVATLPMEDYHGPLYLGVDSGSTTLKVVLMDEDLNIRYSAYYTNKGNPVQIFKKILDELYEKYPDINIATACSTGYGEDLIKNVFNLDGGIVETMAHFRAAKHFRRDVDFIIDIGGQDIKCFKVENGVISSIFLNEACSSGCGSFLQTFANALGYDIEEFSKLGLFAEKPVDLGSRCTVFMNSSVKQAQKDGATMDNISAGLSISVVKNALYKVIRAPNVESLGKHIVVQGGTFYNEAVLRAFERELNLDVVCPNIAGLMGAYGAALYAKSLHIKKSTILTAEDLKDFHHEVTYTKCTLCPNRCNLSINSFGKGGKRYISGNQCERPVSGGTHSNDELNIYEYVRTRLDGYKPVEGPRGHIALPMVLNNFELLPFWHTFFTTLGFTVITSGPSSHKLYTSGQHTIPSDTVCYPAKLVHGHIEKLLADGEDVIWYPCMTYNIDEHRGDNHYNCPIVAYYPENAINNIKALADVTFINDFLNLADPDKFESHVYAVLQKYFPSKKIKRGEVKKACEEAYREYDKYLLDVHLKGQQIIEQARKEGKQIICLAGRPYHVDKEVNHGIDKLISSFDVAIVNEESMAYEEGKFGVNVLNQWTYHSRLYAAARHIIKQPDINLIQLVSFGCGLDAITSDETKEILERNGRIYTQIKIDEITNLGAVRIRLRSLFEALKQEKEGNVDE